MDRKLVAKELLKVAKALIGGSLKIKPDDKTILYSLLDKYVAREGRDELAKYKESLKHDPKVKDVDMRFRWDLVHGARVSIGDGKGAKGHVELYAYMTDENIDAVLKAYVKEKKL